MATTVPEKTQTDLQHDTFVQGVHLRTVCSITEQQAVLPHILHSARKSVQTRRQNAETRTASAQTRCRDRAFGHCNRQIQAQCNLKLLEIVSGIFIFCVTLHRLMFLKKLTKIL